MGPTPPRSKRLPEKFEFFETLKCFHPDVCLSQTHNAKFCDLKLTDFHLLNYDVDEIEKQYMAVRCINWSSANVALYDQTKFCCHVYEVKKAAEDHPDLCRMLAKIVLTNLSLPLCNVFVERLFSQVSIVKNKLLKRNSPVVESCFNVGLILGTSGRTDCDVIDVNSAPDESAKESSYFHVHGSHL